MVYTGRIRNPANTPKVKNMIKNLYKNWTVHNLVAHPLMEIVYLLSFGKAKRASTWIHDVTLPISQEVNARD